jgi:hypothetical protein
MHPLNTAGSFQAREAAAPFVITGSYLDPAPSITTIERDGIRLTFHSEHRPPWSPAFRRWRRPGC